MECRDYTVSHETFKLVTCSSCGLVITTPRPGPDALGRYYLSENYISHATETTSLFDAVYRIARNYNLTRKLNLIHAHTSTPPQHLLDFGCGTGEFLRKVQTANIRVSGVEPSAKARNHANMLTGGAVTDTLRHAPESFDVITLWHVLEHLENLNAQFALLVSALRKSGTMFIAVPNHRAYDARYYQEYWAGFDVPRHLWHFTRDSIQRLLEKHEMKLKTIVPMKLDAYYVSMLSEQYRQGKPSITSRAKGLLAGLKSNRHAQRTREYSSLIYIAEK